MAEYIENVAAQTSKLDWAFPFERKGQFPLDRSAIFSSLSDATKYATGDGSDERKLGGTSYVGQIISVYEAGEEGATAVVNAYIITPARGLMKLAATTASGDIASDVADLQGKVNTLISDLDTLEATVAGMYTNEQIDAFIEGAKDDRVDGLIEAVGSAAEGEEAASGLYKLIADEAKAREDADKALDDKIKAIDFIDEDELATALEPYAKSEDVEADIKEASDTLTLEINKKVDGTTYATDKKALEDEDAAIRAIAEGVKSRVDTFLDTEGVAEVVDSLKDIKGELDKMADATEMVEALAKKADVETVNGINGRVEELEKIDHSVYAVKSDVETEFAKYTNTEDMNILLAGKQDVIAEGTYATPDDVATSKGEAISDAEGKIATAKSEAINAAATDAEGKVNALANGAVKDNADAIAIINDAENGILAQAKADATAKADAAKSGAEATAAGLYATKEYVGIVPEGKGDTVIAYINKKAEETLAAAQGGSSETAASVAQALQNYKDLNDPKVSKNTEDIAGLRTDLTTEAGKITNLQGVVEGHTTKITDLETLTSGHTATIESHTQSVASLNGSVATKAEQTALDAAVADIAKNTAAITTLNETTIPGINTEIGKKANSADVYTKTALDAIIGTPAEGKTIVDMINDAQTAATYDDTQVKADIKKNSDAIAKLNGDDKTEGSVDYKVAQEVAKILNDNDDSDIDTLNEIAAWITNDTTGAAKMNADIVANAAAITKLNGDVNTEGSVLAMIKANAPEIATTELAGLVKSVATTVENGIHVAEDGTMSVNSINVNKLVQDENDFLVLNGGSANI